jgi:hypothetical protein
MTPLSFYLYKAILNKEFTQWSGVTREKKKSGVSYIMHAISQRRAPTHTNGVGPSTNLSKRERMPSGSKEEEDEGKEETLPRSIPLLLP